MRAARDGKLEHIGRFKSKLAAAVAFSRFEAGMPSRRGGGHDGGPFGNMVLQVEMPASMEDGVCNTIEKILDFRVVDVDDDDAADGAATADGGKLAMVFHRTKASVAASAAGFQLSLLEERAAAHEMPVRGELLNVSVAEAEDESGEPTGVVAWKQAEVRDVLAEGRFLACIDDDEDFFEEYTLLDQHVEWRRPHTQYRTRETAAADRQVEDRRDTFAVSAANETPARGAPSPPAPPPPPAIAAAKRAWRAAAPARPTAEVSRTGGKPPPPVEYEDDRRAEASHLEERRDEAIEP